MFKPDAQQLRALQLFAERNGRQWKANLRSIWLHGSEQYEANGGLLRQLRNQGGPEWLARFKLPTAKD